jgi:PAS domain-containing protein
MASKPAEASEDVAPTHGICPACAQKLIAKHGRPLQEFLDDLDAPVLLVDDRAVVIAANQRAQNLLGKKLPLLAGRPAGDAINCIHAKTPEGCGNTVHCRTCAIRVAVTRTFASGQPQTVEAYPDVELCSIVKRLRFRISTWKEDQVVLLRIEELPPNKRQTVP